jgi:hypothetical protein
VPLVVAVLMAVHFWRIRKDGGEAGPPPPSRRELEATRKNSAHVANASTRPAAPAHVAAPVAQREGEVA